MTITDLLEIIYFVLLVAGCLGLVSYIFTEDKKDD